MRFLNPLKRFNLLYVTVHLMDTMAEYLNVSIPQRVQHSFVRWFLLTTSRLFSDELNFRKLDQWINLDFGIILLLTGIFDHANLFCEIYKTTLCHRRIDNFLKRLFLYNKHAKTTYNVVLACLWHKNSLFKKVSILL